MTSVCWIVTTSWAMWELERGREGCLVDWLGGGKDETGV